MMKNSREKKIGIVTYHRAYNYGASLQAYALKTFLSMNVQQSVHFVDYWPSYHAQIYDVFNLKDFLSRSILGKMRYLLEFPYRAPNKYRRAGLFNRFIKQYLSGNEPFLSTNEVIDTVVYGSDQIWRYQNRRLYKGYNLVYFGGTQIRAKKRVAYAGSSGSLPIGKSEENLLKNYFKNFDFLSCRELQLNNLVTNNFKIESKLVVDPVFLLSFEQWKKMIPTRKVDKKFVLIYNIHRSHIVPDLSKALATQFGLRELEIIGNTNIIEKQNQKGVLGPLEFLDYIFYADYVVTSSFHGVAFAILLQKQFFVHLEVASDRVISLLEICGLADRLVDNTEDMMKMKEIDYANHSFEALDSLIVESKEYLLSAVR